jgi:hypothetical protein
MQRGERKLEAGVPILEQRVHEVAAHDEVDVWELREQWVWVLCPYTQVSYLACR